MQRLLPLGERAQHAELIALWVGHDHPCDVDLTDVEASRPKTLQPSNFCLLIAIRTKIEVNPVLGGLRAVGWHQGQPAARPVGCCEQMAPRRAGPDVLEVEGVTPERGHHIEIDTVDENAVDDERHSVIVAAQRTLFLGIFEGRRSTSLRDRPCPGGGRQILRGRPKVTDAEDLAENAIPAGAP